jgi:hypothetical protein
MLEARNRARRLYLVSETISRLRYVVTSRENNRALLPLLADSPLFA